MREEQKHQMDNGPGLTGTLDRTPTGRLDSQPVQISEAVDRVGINFRVPPSGIKAQKERREAERRKGKKQPRLFAPPGRTG